MSLAHSTVCYWLKKYGLESNRRPTQYRCRHCGETNPENFHVANVRNKTKPLYSVCKSCFNQMRTESFKINRNKSLDYLGGKCILCGFDEYEALEIHHLDPNKKDKNYDRYRGWSWERITAELSGCTLLCRNCHALVHANLICIVESVVKRKLGMPE